LCRGTELALLRRGAADLCAAVMWCRGTAAYEAAHEKNSHQPTTLFVGIYGPVKQLKI
jgi:hypothetical protein